MELGLGQEIGFHREGTNWVAYDLEAIRYQLKETANFYYLFDPIEELVYTFTKDFENANNVIGLLAAVQDRNGNTLNYTYPTNNDRFLRGPDRVRDGLGRELRFTYQSVGSRDRNPFLVRVEDQNQRRWTFRYEEAPADNRSGTGLPGIDSTVILRSITDPLGQVTTFRYNNLQRIVRVQRPAGNSPYSQTYDPAFTDRGVTRTQSDALGNTTRITPDQFESRLEVVDVNGIPVGVRRTGEESQFTVTHPDSTQRVFRHQRGSRVVQSVTDEAGHTATFDADPIRDRITRVTDREGGTTSFTYHPETGKLASVTNAKGDTLRLTYTAQNRTFTNPVRRQESVTFTAFNLTRTDYPDGANEQFTYDARGNVLTRRDQAGQTTTYTYNTQGQVLTVTNPVLTKQGTNGVTTFTYNTDTTLASSTDSDTGVTAYGYDNFKRLTRITRPDASTVQIAYDLKDRLTSLTDENNQTYRYTYDANDNLTAVTDPAGNMIQVSYDALDRVTQVTDRLGKTTNLSYDNRERLASITDPTRILTSFEYDPRSFLTEISRAGRTFQTSYDNEGIPTAQTTPLGHTTDFQTDALGFLTRVTDPLRQTSTMTRDALSRMTAVTDPLNRTASFAYDGRGDLMGVTAPVIGTARYQRNGLGRLSQITDLLGQRWSFGYTNMGRLASITDPLNRRQQLAYDTRGGLTQVTYPDGVTATSSYDPAGNLTRVRYSDGTDLQYSYDALNRLIETNGLKLSYDAESQVINSENPGTNFGASYDDAGRLKTVSYNNGAFTVNYTYDMATGLLAQVSDSLTRAQVEFVYDDDFRLVGLRRSNGVHTTLTWDDASRLTRIQDGDVLDLQYTLDAAGQVTQLNMMAPLDPASFLVGQAGSLSYDVASQVSSPGYRHDARGRLTTAPGQMFTWDGASRLVGVGQDVILS